jgi:hypothetical protein
VAYMRDVGGLCAINIYVADVREVSGLDRYLCAIDWSGECVCGLSSRCGWLMCDQ